VLSYIFSNNFRFSTILPHLSQHRQCSYYYSDTNWLQIDKTWVRPIGSGTTPNTLTVRLVSRATCYLNKGTSFCGNVARITGDVISRSKDPKSRSLSNAQSHSKRISMQEQNTVERHIYHLPTVGYSRQTGLFLDAIHVGLSGCSSSRKILRFTSGKDQNDPHRSLCRPTAFWSRSTPNVKATDAKMPKSFFSSTPPQFQS